jgi:hypothetical protein
LISEISIENATKTEISRKKNVWVRRARSASLRRFLGWVGFVAVLGIDPPDQECAAQAQIIYFDKHLPQAIKHKVATKFNSTLPF